MNTQNSHAGSGYLNNSNQLEKRGLDATTHSADTHKVAHSADIDRLMTLFMNNKATRQLAKTVVQYNSAAVLGALAYKANEYYRRSVPLCDVAPITGHDITQSSPLPRFIDNRENYGEDFLTPVLMKAMIAAAKADGLVDADEQAQLPKAAGQLGFNESDSDFIAQLLTRHISPEEIAQSVVRNKHKSEVYLAAYFAISGQRNAGRVFLKYLANVMDLETGLSTYLERQADHGIAK